MVEVTSQYKSLKKSLLFKFMVMAAVSLLLSLMVYVIQYQIQKSSVTLLQDNTLLAAHNTLSRELGDVRKVVQLLVADDILKQSDEIALLEEQIQIHFVNFGLAAENISQIRWLDRKGQEKVRVNFKTGQAELVPKQQLQNKSSRYYFTEGMEHSQGEVYISPIDLNVERGAVVTPHEPTLRASYRTTSDNFVLDGLVVVNFDLSKTLQQIKSLSTLQAQIQLINGEGYWLLHPQKEKEWGFMREKSMLTLGNEDSQLWQAITQLPKSQELIASHSHATSFLKMNLGNKNAAGTNDIVVLVEADDSVQNEIILRSFIIALACAVTLISISGLYLKRSYRDQRKIIKARSHLEQEQQELLAANTKLQRYIKQQHQLQGELIEAQRLSSLGLMVAGVAHEMNTPLGGAAISLSNAQLINQQLKDKIDEGFTKQFLESSVEKIDDNLLISRVNLDKAISHVKSFKEMAHDRSNDQLVSFNIEKVISDLLLGLKSRFKASQVTIETYIDVKKDITSRPGVISQVIESLIVNAVSHAFNELDDKLIQLHVYLNQQGDVCITISDNGCGIDDSLRSNLFDPFVTTSRKHGHTGLGLYLVHEWVTSVLNGKIQLVANTDLPEGIATKFKITLPIVQKSTVS
ncbi:MULTISPECIES: HAMP domain-containing sensor histidine kinase [unclassified Pseudoalteromonas]|uniref:sensor histidine kinase n=1 Tax=Pseudoalteromonas TaxID=53246 RepID=UPI00202B0817|nr:MULTISPECIES: HAMP domain-containing sensor histidine kinase [unclassified Pseudoalteromonas]URQ89437.1 HAMP domain-containing histidine kinase [Pseudoalteromonas sp. SCSIO 43101]